MSAVVSGTSAFNLEFDDIIDLGYQRAFGEEQTGYDLQKANKQLSLVFQEFQLRGDALWTMVTEAIVPSALAADGGQYVLDPTVVDVRSMWTRDLTITPPSDDLVVSRIPNATYELIPNKLDPGRSYQYYLDRQRDAPVLRLYPVINVDNNYAIWARYVRRIYDVGAYTNNADIPVRWLPILIAGLAWYIGRDNRKLLGMDWVNSLHEEFEAIYNQGSIEDSDSSPTRIEVDASAYFGR